MTTLTITTPTTKAGKVAYFTIEFLVSNFDTVLDKVETLTNPEDVYSIEKTGIWKVK